MSKTRKATSNEVQVDYPGKVMELDPFCMGVQFELGGDVYDVSDKDDWEWA